MREPVVAPPQQRGRCEDPYAPPPTRWRCRSRWRPRLLPRSDRCWLRSVQDSGSRRAAIDRRVQPAAPRPPNVLPTMPRGTPGRPPGRIACRRSRPVLGGLPRWSSSSYRSARRSLSRNSPPPQRCAHPVRSPRLRVPAGSQCRRTSRDARGCSWPTVRANQPAGRQDVRLRLDVAGVWRVPSHRVSRAC